MYEVIYNISIEELTRSIFNELPFSIGDRKIYELEVIISIQEGFLTWYLIWK